MRRLMMTVLGGLLISTMWAGRASANDDDHRYRDHDSYRHHRDHDYRRDRDYRRYRYDRDYSYRSGDDYDDYDAARDEYQRFLDWRGGGWDTDEFNAFRQFRRDRSSGESWSDFDEYWR